MKFSLKVFFCTIVVIAAALSFGGFYLVDSVFRSALERETQQALDENSILRFAFETSALNVPAKYERLQDKTIEQIGETLETGRYRTSRFIRISDDQKNPLYTSGGFTADNGLLLQTGEKTQAYKIIKADGRYYAQVAVSFEVVDRTLYLETLRDISSVFSERDAGFSVYRRVTVVTLLVGALIMYMLSIWLTRPISHLSRVAKSMAGGNYRRRARKMSNDELGLLTMDFNIMANALEEKINQLQDEARAREDFVAAFAHELKTPLTSIIGYADLLRSRKLDEEERFLSASYIYQEGKRLEALSFKLLDLIVLKRQDLLLRPVSAGQVFSYLEDTFSKERGVSLTIDFDDAEVQAEQDLLKTVLVNLIDNACKASEPGGRIEVTGRLEAGGYRFSVRDFGCGIPEDELDKITEAFYMVDKSRSRDQNGAGLGLALCSVILELHGSGFLFESKVGEGTCVSFVLPLRRAENEKDF